MSQPTDTKEKRSRIYAGHLSERTKPVRTGVVRVWALRRLEYSRRDEKPPLHGRLMFLVTLLWLLSLLLP